MTKCYSNQSTLNVTAEKMAKHLNNPGKPLRL